MAVGTKVAQSPEWAIKAIANLLKGLDPSLPPDNLPDGYSVVLNNMRMSGGRLRRDTGYVNFGDAVRGTPQYFQVWVKNSGTEELIGITTATIYKYNTSSTSWDYLSNGTSTLLDGAHTTSDKTILVDDITGFSDGDFLGIALTDGSQHKTTIDGAPSGNTITIDDGLPSGASNNAVLLKAPVLSGTAAIPITSDRWEADDWFIFTNGVDVPKRYDGTDVTDISGLSGVNVGTARSLVVARNQILLFRTTESAVIFPNRVRRSKIGDGTDWTTGTAGTEDIPEGLVNIHTAKRLGNDLVIYFDNGVVTYQYTGDTADLWRYSVASKADGIVGPAAITDLAGAHVFLGHKDVWVFRGGSGLLPLGRNTLTETGVGGMLIHTITSSLNRNSKERSHLLVVPELSELWIITPDAATTSPTHVVRYNLQTGGWTEREFTHAVLQIGPYLEVGGETWTTATGTWDDWAGIPWNSPLISTAAPVLLFANAAASQVYAYDFTASADDGTAISWEIQTGDYTELGKSMRIDWFEVWASGTSFSAEMSMDGGATWTVLGTVTPGAVAKSYRVHKQLIGRSFRLRLTGTGATTIGWLAWRWRPESVE